MGEGARRSTSLLLTGTHTWNVSNTTEWAGGLASFSTVFALIVCSLPGLSEPQDPNLLITRHPPHPSLPLHLVVGGWEGNICEGLL